MKKTLTTLGLAACLLGVPALSAVADAHPYHRYETRYSEYGHHDRAWRIVRNDQCRYDEYRRFAAHHQNPVKRRRMIEQLAYHGCSRPHVYHRWHR